MPTLNSRKGACWSETWYAGAANRKGTGHQASLTGARQQKRCETATQRPTATSTAEFL